MAGPRPHARLNADESQRSPGVLPIVNMPNLPTDLPANAARDAGADDAAAVSDNRLIVAISSRALFDLGDSHALF